MVRGLLVTGLVLLGTSSAMAFGHVGGPPTQQMVRIDTSGQMQVYYQVMMCIPETQTRTVTEKVPVTEEYSVEVDGQVVKKTRTVYKDVHKQIQVTVSKTVCQMQVRKAMLDDLKAFETDGKAISPKKLKERLTEDTLVVVSANDEMIPEYYAGLFKPGTIILAFKPEPMGHRAMPAPVAPPGGENAPQPPQAGVSSTSLRLVTQPKSDDKDAVEIRVPEFAPGPQFPQTMPPLYVFASRDGAENYKLRQLTENSYETTGYKVKKQGTGKQMVPVKMTQIIRHNEITAIAGKDLQFFSCDGSAMAGDRIKEKLSREGTILYSADGEAVDPFWLQNFKATTLVLVGPQLPGGCGGPMMGYGAAPMPAMPVLAPPPQVAPAPAPAPAEAPKPAT